ncbi:hypothetical protein NC653_031225 [Populus alba x Populus x berolinensis]|uniref:Uncharacterized protein n=1 Tax=Populus alba x Populus x berolinensis TaxID=444605 RepID=A0AAD6LXU1_9ROSI|nr:hypothetical protein NC653_031225 [Populus alba x Populus x berolinensis]
MTASNLMLSALRRSRPLSTLSRLLANPNPNSNSNSLTSQPAIPSRNSLASFHFPSCQSFSTRTDDDSDFLASESPTASEPINFKLDAITEGVVNGSNVFEESIFPVDNHCFINIGNENDVVPFTRFANVQDKANLTVFS